MRTVQIPRRTPESKTPKPSVYLTGMWAHPFDGWSVATRAYLKAFHLAGRGSILGYDPLNRPDEDTFNEMKWMLDASYHVDAVDLMVWSGMIQGAERMVPLFKELKRQGNSGVYMVFERLSFEPELIEALNGLPVWVESPTNRDVLESYGIEADWIPFPIFRNDYINRSADTARRFYWIGCWEPRKAPDRLIRAFMRAFSPQDECSLTLKVSPLGRGFDWEMSPERAILEAMRDYPKWTLAEVDRRITIIRRRLDDGEMRFLHQSNGIYVSPSLGEALELGAWDAKLSGARIVTTENGGVNHYLDVKDILIPSTGESKAHEGYQWGKGATLIDYDIEDISSALRLAITTGLPKDVWWDGIQNHSAEKVGQQLVSWCERHSNV